MDDNYEPCPGTRSLRELVSRLSKRTLQPSSLTTPARQQALMSDIYNEYCRLVEDSAQPCAQKTNNDTLVPSHPSQRPDAATLTHPLFPLLLRNQLLTHIIHLQLTTIQQFLRDTIKQKPMDEGVLLMLQARSTLASIKSRLQHVQAQLASPTEYRSSDSAPASPSSPSSPSSSSLTQRDEETEEEMISLNAHLLSTTRKLELALAAMIPNARRGEEFDSWMNWTEAIRGRLWGWVGEFVGGWEGCLAGQTQEPSCMVRLRGGSLGRWGSLDGRRGESGASTLVGMGLETQRQQQNGQEQYDRGTGGKRVGFVEVGEGGVKEVERCVECDVY